MPNTMQSKFDSKCKHCGIEIKKGDTVHKVNEHWCKNQLCLQSIKEPVDIPPYPRIHKKIWIFAVAEAAKAMPDRAGRANPIPGNLQKVYGLHHT